MPRQSLRERENSLLYLIKHTLREKGSKFLKEQCSVCVCVWEQKTCLMKAVDECFCPNFKFLEFLTCVITSPPPAALKPICARMFRKGRRKRLRSSTPTAPSPTQEQQLNSTLSVEHFVCLHSVLIGTFRAANMRSAKCQQSESPQF